MTEIEKKEQKKKEVEDVLYRWKYFENEEEKYDKFVSNIEEKIKSKRENYPQILARLGGESNKISNTTEKSAIFIINNLDKQLKNIKKIKENKLSMFFKIRKILDSLDGDEKELIRLKYYCYYRGEKLYSMLNYSKSGYLHKKKRIIEKIMIRYCSENNI